MKYAENIKAISAMRPDFMGFIFYAQSPRCMQDTLTAEMIIELGETLDTVGVFVNAEIKNVLAIQKEYNLHYVQLHGNESAEYCSEIKASGVGVIKAFRIHPGFDFNILTAYRDVDYFLFDTRSETYGGSGKQFEWNVLNEYTLETPYFLSGGIGPEDVERIKSLDLPLMPYAIDVNSRFEISPGIKDAASIQSFINIMRT